MWIWTAKKLANFHAKRLNPSENNPKSFRGLLFWNTLYYKRPAVTIITTAWREKMIIYAVFTSDNNHNRLTGRTVEDLSNPLVVGTARHVPCFSGAGTTDYQFVFRFTFHNCSISQLQISTADDYNRITIVDSFTFDFFYHVIGYFYNICQDGYVFVFVRCWLVCPCVSRIIQQVMDEFAWNFSKKYALGQEIGPNCLDCGVILRGLSWLTIRLPNRFQSGSASSNSVIIW